MRLMLFEMMVSGHRPEYIHHIYMGMLNRKDDSLVIVVPRAFEEKKNLYVWPEASNIKFCYMDDSLTAENGSGIKQSFHRTRILRDYIYKEGVDRVFLITLIAYTAALWFYIPRKVKVTGILYSIYLYTWKTSSIVHRLQEVFKYIIMRLTPCLKIVYVLNDPTSAVRLNKLYLSNKFQFITDPYNAIDYQPQDIRKELGAKEDDKIFLHFGGLDRRKGTLDILQAIQLLPQKHARHCVFVFAGKIYDPIREEFFLLKNGLPSEARILVYDQFCTNEFIADLCYSSDFVLLPYHDTNRSSGLLGHAAHYGTPVIGPSDGLIGELIQRKNLGLLLPRVNAESIARAICDATPFKVNTDYNELIRVENFVNSVIDNANIIQ